MRSFAIAVCAAAGTLALTTGSALATQINTGGETGAYHSRFCPELRKQMAKSAFEFECVASQGSRENIQRVLGNPEQIAYSQFDVYALEREMTGGEETLTTLRTDLGRECVFMVTRNRDLTSYGAIASVAPDLKFVLPPERSGSAATFEFLQQIDPDGLALAQDITYAETTDAAIEAALADERTVTLFVQFPDPNNPRFKAIDQAEGVFVPVLDRNILRQQINGEKIYYAQETELTNPRWHKVGTEVVTACTPMVLFTGASSLIEDGNKRRDHEDMIKTVRAIPAEDLQPREGLFQRIWKKTKELSARSVERAIQLSEDAREAAGPTLDRAREKAGELADTAREKGGELWQQGREMIDRAREQLQNNSQ
ncbi:MAG: hypothetical protein GC150_12115 [Rhizobiales bacterium]|nr:hypothetical protein [Hyphomicrobiales bacterium]